MNAPPLFKHQQETIDFLAANDNVFISSDPGTGKTRCILEHLAANKDKGRALVIAPKSILAASWAEDCRKFTPQLTYAIADASCRADAFKANTNIVLINHDGVKWVNENTHVLDGFYFLVIDESTAYKNHTAQRSKAVDAIAKLFQKRIAMTGTPNPNGIIDLFHQIKILDGGQRLGKSYWAFRAATHQPIAKGQFTEWVEKDGIQDAVYGLIADINIRYELEKCLDMPENVITEVNFNLSPTHLKLYHRLKQDAILQLEKGEVTAVNAASLATKLMQAASGCVYGDDGEHLLSTDRYELIMDLVEAREQCVIAFMWGHQRDRLIQEAEKRKFSYAVIDGSVPVEMRTLAVEQFQRGDLRLILAHPASASHGLTLTAGTTTIWASPTYNAEHYQQFCRRIYRAGQTRRTETIHIAANQTIDVNAYNRLTGKLDKMQSLLELLSL